MPRGGARAGAGRKSFYREALVRISVTLPESYIEQLRREGSGSVSEGIRWLVENARGPAGGFWYQAELAGQPAPLWPGGRARGEEKV